MRSARLRVRVIQGKTPIFGVAQIRHQLPRRHHRRRLRRSSSPAERRNANGGDTSVLSVPQHVFLIEIHKLVLIDMLDHQRRMRVDHYLPKGIVGIDGVLGAHGDVAQQIHHHRNAIGMNAVLRCPHSA